MRGNEVSVCIQQVDMRVLLMHLIALHAAYLEVAWY